MTAGRAYLSGGLAAVASFGATGLAGILSLYLLTQILDKSEFGAYSLAANVIILCGLVGSFGMDRTLLLRLSSQTDRPARLRGGQLALRAACVALVVSGALILMLWLLLATLATHVLSPTSIWWIAALSPAAMIMALRLVLRGWFQANHRVGAAALLPGISDTARAVLFLICFLVGAQAVGIALAFVISAILPLSYLWWRARGRVEMDTGTIGLSDISRGAVFAGQKIVDMGLNLIDVILVGLILTEATTAEYALAARLAATTDLGRIALATTFTPRVRKFYEARDTAALTNEYNRARYASMSAATMIALILLFLGEQILLVFGDYSESYRPLLILASGYIFAAGCGLHIPYLSMTGDVRRSIIVRTIGLTTAIVLLLLLTPRIGTTGAAISIFISMVLINLGSLASLWSVAAFRGLSRGAVLFVLVVPALMIMTAFAILPALLTAACLVAILALAATLDRTTLLAANGVPS